MNREVVLSLLKEITSSCSSFYEAQSVSIARNPETEGYLLRAKWTPMGDEERVLADLAKKYDARISQVDGFLVLHKAAP